MKKEKKIYTLDPLIFENRRIYPVVCLKVLVIADTFINSSFEVLALKISEEDHVYYKNVSMKENDFEKLKKEGYEESFSRL